MTVSHQSSAGPGNTCERAIILSILHPSSGKLSVASFGHWHAVHDQDLESLGHITSAFFPLNKG